MIEQLQDNQYGGVCDLELAPQDPRQGNLELGQDEQDYMLEKIARGIKSADEAAKLAELTGSNCITQTNCTAITVIMRAWKRRPPRPSMPQHVWQ